MSTSLVVPVAHPERLSVVAIPAILTWTLCFFRIGGSQFRGDELCTWWAATLPPPAFERLVGHVDAVLAPYYLLIAHWVRLFGDSEAALRAPSALAMGVAAGLVAALGARLANPRVGLRAGLVFALLPAVSRFGQEARPYAFATLFAALSSLLALRLVERPRSLARGFSYAAALAALGLRRANLLLLERKVAAAQAKRP